MRTRHSVSRGDVTAFSTSAYTALADAVCRLRLPSARCCGRSRKEKENNCCCAHDNLLLRMYCSHIFVVLSALCYANTSKGFRPYVSTRLWSTAARGITRDGRSNESSMPPRHRVPLPETAMVRRFPASDKSHNDIVLDQVSNSPFIAEKSPGHSDAALGVRTANLRAAMTGYAKVPEHMLPAPGPSNAASGCGLLYMPVRKACAAGHQTISVNLSR